MSPDTDTNIQTGADTTGQGQSEQGTVPPINPATVEGQEGTTTTPPPTTPPVVKEPNVRLGRGHSAIPEGPLNIGMKTVDMPDEATQQTGFYTEEVGALTAQFPQYKFFKTLGE